MDGLRSEWCSDFLEVIHGRNFAYFLSRQHLISESMVAEAWCLVLAVTVLEMKKGLFISLSSLIQVWSVHKGEGG